MAGFVFAPGPGWLWIAAAGIGVAWAAILSLPYAIIVNSVPPAKVGVYLGIHNIFLVVPQLVARSPLSRCRPPQSVAAPGREGLGGNSAFPGIVQQPDRQRSEEGRVGNGGVSTCSSRWSPCH